MHNSIGMQARRSKSWVLASALGVTVGLQPVQALAQRSAAPAVAASDVEGSGEIVVTAQRRSERLSDVPISVTALSSAQITAAGVDSTYALQQVTPGLRMERLGAYTQPSIRGVTAGATSPGAEANVAIYVDGIYQPNQAANTIELPDVARVEVSKGPQGTLFGRNATGGAIQIFTREPSYDPHASFTVGYGSYDNLLIKGFAAAPLIDNKLAISIAGLYEDMDGWNHDLLKGGKIGKVQSRLIRGKLLFEPTETVKFVLSGQYSHRHDESLFAYSALNGNTAGAAPIFASNGPIATKPYDVSVNTASIVDTKSWNVALRGSIDLGGIGTLSSLTAYARTDLQISADGDASPTQLISFTIQSPDKNFTQEINFASEKFGPVQVIAGLFYYSDSSGYDPLVGFFPGSFTNFSDVTVKAYAAYAEANVDILPGLVGIAGVRYSNEKRTVQYTGGDAAFYVGTALHEKTFDAFTPRFSLRYEVAPRTNVYATYSKGFKSGVYDLNSTATSPVNPETIQAFEVGIKTGQRTFNLSAAAFYYNYKNLQVQVNTGGFDALQNAGGAHNYGFDIEGSVHVTPDFSLSGGLAYLHARYTNYPNASILVPRAGGGNDNVSANLGGFQVTRAPNWTLNLAATYEHEFAFGTVGASANLYHADDVPLEQSGRVRQPAYTQINAQFSLSPANTNFKFTVWGKNLADEKVIQGSFFTGAGDQVSYAPPRTFGGTIGYAF